MIRIALILALIPAVAMAQTGGAGPSSTTQATMNAKAADGVSKGFTTPTPAGANILIGASTQVENCGVPFSAGIGTLAYGFTAVWARALAGCEHRRTAMDMLAVAGAEALAGDKDGSVSDIHAARAELCEMDDAQGAYAKGGHPCP